MQTFSRKLSAFLWILTATVTIYSCTNKKADPAATPQPSQPDPSSGCDTAQLSFAADIMPVFQQNCALSGCHNTVTRAGGYAYTDYNGILQPIQSGRLLGAINHQAGYVPMPQNAPKLSDCDIAKITHWIAIGTPDN